MFDREVLAFYLGDLYTESGQTLEVICVGKISARAFQRIFTCKIWLRYSRERALKKLPELLIARHLRRDEGERAGDVLGLVRRRAAEAEVQQHLREDDDGDDRAHVANRQNLANFWRARSLLYQNRFLQVNMTSARSFNLLKICTLLHRSKLNILAKSR